VPQEPAENELFQVFQFHGFTTVCAAMLPLLRMARRAAAVSDITVLLEGETGTGKQVLAQAIHNLDEKRKSFPFVTVHCSTISETLAESELFGHQRGSFSGAAHDRVGLFQAAHRGTLFLDDVNDLPAPLQPKLLDVLQRGIVRSLGSDRELPINIRVIAAANQPLAKLVLENRFRGDLYHRLNVVRLSLPPLRERSADLAALALAFARKHAHIYPNIAHIEPELVAFLQSCRFPGNVRELEHAVERMLFSKTEGAALQMSDCLAQYAASEESEPSDNLVSEAAERLWIAIFQHGMPFSDALKQLERVLLETALNQEGKTRREMAGRLHTSERTLYHKLRNHNLTRA
jgi:transcriptional regulator with PAS, ATPase and Fis domain